VPHALQDFIHPKDMLAPGVIGLMTMIITNALGAGFDLPHSWTALAISGLFGILVGIPPAGHLVQRGLFLVLNSLIIFSMATGANVIADPVATKGKEVAAIVQSRIVSLVGRTQEIARKIPEESDRIKKEASHPFFRQWF
jgi:hypothetical protein